MKEKNKLLTIIFTVLFFSLLEITMIKASGCNDPTSNTCPTDICEIKCGERFIRNLSVGQDHYYNFTITQTMRVTLIVRNVTSNSDFDLTVTWIPLQCCAYCCGPNCCGPSSTGACSRNTVQDLAGNNTLPSGTYYFLVHLNESGDGNVQYNLSMSCIARSAGAFCCGPSTDKKCYTSGVCCLMGTPSEYWHPTGCFGFDTWVKPERMMFTLGTKIPVGLYIENRGSYTDVYDVDYEIDPFISSLVKVDMSGVSPTSSVAHGEVKKLYPRIITLYTDVTGDVMFNVTSYGDPTLYKNTKLKILASDFPLSLPEFGIFGLLGMIVLAGIVYIISRRKK